MHSKRAQEILESYGVIEVLYQNQPVWIEEIIDDNRAIVSLMTTRKQQEVSISELTESNADILR